MSIVLALQVASFVLKPTGMSFQPQRPPLRPPSNLGLKQTPFTKRTLLESSGFSSVYGGNLINTDLEKAVFGSSLNPKTFVERVGICDADSCHLMTGYDGLLKLVGRLTPLKPDPYLLAHISDCIHTIDVRSIKPQDSSVDNLIRGIIVKTNDYAVTQNLSDTTAEMDFSFLNAGIKILELIHTRDLDSSLEFQDFLKTYNPTQLLGHVNTCIRTTRETNPEALTMPFISRTLGLLNIIEEHTQSPEFRQFLFQMDTCLNPLVQATPHPTMDRPNQDITSLLFDPSNPDIIKIKRGICDGDSCRSKTTTEAMNELLDRLNSLPKTLPELVTQSEKILRHLSTCMDRLYHTNSSEIEGIIIQDMLNGLSNTDAAVQSLPDYQKLKTQCKIIYTTIQ